MDDIDAGTVAAWFTGAGVAAAVAIGNAKNIFLGVVTGMRYIKLAIGKA